MDLPKLQLLLDPLQLDVRRRLLLLEFGRSSCVWPNTHGSQHLSSTSRVLRCQRERLLAVDAVRNTAQSYWLRKYETLTGFPIYLVKYYVLVAEQCQYPNSLTFSNFSHITQLDDVSFTATYTCDVGYEGSTVNSDVVVYMCSVDDGLDEDFHDCTG